MKQTRHSRLRKEFRYLATQVLHDFFGEATRYDVICDETNNTPDVIANGTLIVDVHIVLPSTVHEITLCGKVTNDT